MATCTEKGFSTFDKFLGGDKNIQTVLTHHFNNQMDVNGINIAHIYSKIKKDELLSSEKLEDNKYALYIEAPSTKTYKQIQLILAFDNNKVIFITIAPCTKDGKKRREYYGKNEYDNRNKLIRNAINKRKK